MTTFRPMDITTDAAEIARLYRYTTAEAITPETVRDWWTRREGEIRVTMLALDESRRAIGYWDVERETWMNPGHFFMKVIVAPEARGQGLGAQMYRDVLEAARNYGATHLESEIREGDVVSLKFAQDRGFKLVHHSFKSTLDLMEFDEHRFDDLMARVHAEGFRFFSLAEAYVTDENKHRLYEVNRAGALYNGSQKFRNH
jgi:GNAT superfamily N-acetyltransferase